MPQITTLITDTIKALPVPVAHTYPSLDELHTATTSSDGGHGARVGEMAECFGGLLSGAFAPEVLRLAGRLHDVGKTFLPPWLPNLPHALTTEQQATMRQHSTLGLSALKHLADQLPSEIVEAAWLHHECYNGTGYPLGLQGNDIPYVARVVGLADVIDALLSRRSYKDGWPAEHVRGYLSEHAGRLFDPHLVQIALDGWDTLLNARASAEKLA